MRTPDLTSLSTILFALLSLASAQTTTSSAAAPGTTLSLLFINTTSSTGPLTAYPETSSNINGISTATYTINCADPSSSSCTVKDATLTVTMPSDGGSGTYDYHTGSNEGGALTIHCTIGSDGKTPTSCTRTVAGAGGNQVTTSTPTESQYTYLPVTVVDSAGSAGDANVSATNASGASGSTGTATTGAGKGVVPATVGSGASTGTFATPTFSGAAASSASAASAASASASSGDTNGKSVGENGAARLAGLVGRMGVGVLVAVVFGMVGLLVM